mmetsp:Transcript_72992/g.206453  ORF Transcript_72992/g.206453 Transcript_72992/m.206453 type:complete len:204 (-) Transcript_72992:328-939(-)
MELPEPVGTSMRSVAQGLTVTLHLLQQLRGGGRLRQPLHDPFERPQVAGTWRVLADGFHERLWLHRDASQAPECKGNFVMQRSRPFIVEVLQQPHLDRRRQRPQCGGVTGEQAVQAVHQGRGKLGICICCHGTEHWTGKLRRSTAHGLIARALDKEDLRRNGDSPQGPRETVLRYRQQRLESLTRHLPPLSPGRAFRERRMDL